MTNQRTPNSGYVTRDDVSTNSLYADGVDNRDRADEVGDEPAWSAGAWSAGAWSAVFGGIHVSVHG
jgi:hypothetical protein